MSPRARTTAPKRSGSSTRRTSTAKRGKGHTALDRLTKSVDAAQDALKDLRGEMSRGSAGLLKDIDKQLKDARKTLRGASKSVIKDLEGLQEKVTPGAKKSASRSTSTGGAKRSTARKSTARSSSSRAGSSRASSARKSTSSRSTGARRSTSSRAKKS